MARVEDLGTRIDLLPEDRHFRDISVAIYRRRREGGPDYLIHSYAPYEGTAERLAYIADELCRLGGLEKGSATRVRFPCGGEHLAALRRLFVRICRRDPGLPAATFDLSAPDKKAGCDILVASEGAGRYRVSAAAKTPMADRRVAAACNGLKKLTGMVDVAGAENTLIFECGMAHDSLVAALLPDALNVRAAAREQDALQAGGVLSAPGRAS